VKLKDKADKHISRIIGDSMKSDELKMRREILNRFVTDMDALIESENLS